MKKIKNEIKKNYDSVCAVLGVVMTGVVLLGGMLLFDMTLDNGGLIIFFGLMLTMSIFNIFMLNYTSLEAAKKIDDTTIAKLLGFDAACIVFLDALAIYYISHMMIIIVAFELLLFVIVGLIYTLKINQKKRTV